MKRLILMRHAKSSWDGPVLADHDRPLNGRGRLSAKAVGDWLRSCGYIPDQAFVSTSTRTRETFARLKLPCDTEFLEDLYHATPREILACLRQASGDTVLLIGHNPGIAELAQCLPSDKPSHGRFLDFPTCATLVTDFDVQDWQAVQTGTAASLNFVIPRELTG
jgi:phosphohistidine phosphatase